MVEKLDDTCLRLDTIPQRDGRTDGQTDREGKAILRSARYACRCVLKKDANRCRVQLVPSTYIERHWFLHQPDITYARRTARLKSMTYG